MVTATAIGRVAWMDPRTNLGLSHPSGAIELVILALVALLLTGRK